MPAKKKPRQPKIELTTTELRHIHALAEKGKSYRDDLLTIREGYVDHFAGVPPEERPWNYDQTTFPLRVRRALDCQDIRQKVIEFCEAELRKAFLL